MRHKLARRTGTLFVSLALLAVLLVSTGLAASADFAPSAVTVPSHVTLTPIKNFDADLQGFKAGNPGENNDGSVVEHYTTLGYGTSGGSIQWTYDKSKAPDACVLDGGEDFYSAAGDGFFLWIKAEAAGKVRLQGLNNDWNSVYCDAEIAAGENLVYFPYSSFKKGEDAASAFTLLGYHICLYPIGMPSTGTLYVDAFSTYEVDESASTATSTPDTTEPDAFSPSEKKVPADVALTQLKNFDDGLQRFAAGNPGSSGEGSVVTHSTKWGYGTSGGSIKWTYDKSKADWSSPSVKDSTNEFYKANGDGYFLWIKSDAAGTARLQGQGNYSDGWIDVYCDAAVEAGENLVYFPYGSFVKNDQDHTKADAFSALGYVNLYLLNCPNAGTAYVDAFGTYKKGVTPPTGEESSSPSQPTTPEQPDEHNPNYHKLIDDFNTYPDERTLIETWSAINTGETGEGCVMSLDTTGQNSVSGNSIKLVYNAAKAYWTSPGTQKRKPDNQDLEGDGFCFWLKTEKAMSMRVAYLTEDAEAVFDIKDIPAGYEGYYHVPFSEIKYFQAGFEVPYDELGFEPTDFYYFTFYVYGPNSQSEDYQNTVWFDDLTFYSKESFEPSDPTSSDPTSSDPTPSAPTGTDASRPTETTGTNAGEEPTDPVQTGVGLPLAAVALAVSAGAVLTVSKRRNRR